MNSKTLALVTVCLILAPSPALAVNVPLTVTEALPEGISGIARTSEPVTVGIPLPQSSGISSVGQLGLIGATAGQFRALAYWPNGAIKWVLVDFQADVPAGGANTNVALIDGGGNFGGTNLASDAGTSITVDTGAARFTVPKANFNLLSQAQVNGQTFLGTGGPGLVVRVPGGTTYASANDPTSQVVIEENGPVRCVVRAMGRLLTPAGSRLMDYTVRLHFYRGKTYVKSYVTLRNALSGTSAEVTMASAGVVLPIDIGTGRRYSFGRAGTTPISGAIAGTETASLFQAATSINGGDTYRWPTPPMTKIGTGSFDYEQKGLQITLGSVVLNALSNIDAVPASGWGDLSDGLGKGVIVAHRWMASYWPCGLELRGDGQAEIELFSKRNSLASFTFGWGAYETRELLFQFHTSSASNDGALYALQYPLVARAPLSQYAQTGAFFGETKLVSPAQQQSWFASRGGTSPSLSNVIQENYRYIYWPRGGGTNQVDMPYLSLIDFVRTGQGGYWTCGEQQSIFKSDSGVRHSDEFDFAASPTRPDNSGSFNEEPFDLAHSHILSMMTYYYMSGNELVRSAIVDCGEYLDAMTSGQMGGYAPQSSLGDGDMRIWSRTLRNFAALEEFTGNAHYRQIVQNMTTQLLNSSDTPPNCMPFGRNRARGYLWMLHGPCTTERRISDFFTVQIHAEAVWEARRLLLRDGLPRVEDMDDYLLGLADFAYNEMYFELNGGTTLMDYGYLYSMLLDSPNNATTNGPSYKSGEIRPISSGRLLGYAYELTGQVKYLDREAKLLKGDIAYVTPRTPSDPKSQSFMYDDLTRGVGGWQRVSDLTVTPLGSGSYSLQWTAPAGATAYKIKYAERPIVDWLGFNQASFTYLYNPAQFVPWFAATNVSNEPAPQAGGTVERFTVSGLDPAKTWSFAVQYQGPQGSGDYVGPATIQDLRVR